MNSKKRLILLGAIAACLAVGLLYVLVWRNTGATLTAEESERMESLRQAAETNSTSGAPPVKFVEPPVKPPTGAREPQN